MRFHILGSDPKPAAPMSVTRELLTRLRNLDDLIELVAQLGYAPCADELNADARRRLGLAAPGLGTRRAAILGRCGALAVYGIVADEPARGPIAAAASRLAQATAGSQSLLLALDSAGTRLVAAASPLAEGASPPSQLRIELRNPSAVATEILQGLAARPGESSLAHAQRIAETLAEEGLSRRFFREFQRLHAHAADTITGMPRGLAAERRDLALVVLTRVLFLYFVQAKGWLARRSDFLPSLLDTALGGGHPFQASTFEPLCFGVLNTPRHQRASAVRALGDLPFLNGGLFERHPMERRFPDAVLPNDTWRDLFDGLFERFHFTVREDRDGDAVDPEMLGRVFEGLMRQPQRRRSGTYFTPRALVGEIVTRAFDAAGVPHRGHAGPPVRILDPAVGSGAFLLEALHQLEETAAPLRAGESRAGRRRAIVRDSLFGVDADPMAVRLAELRLWLAIVVDDDATPTDVAPLPNLDWNVRQGDSLISPLDGAAWPAALAAGRLTAVAERRTRYYAAVGPEKTSLGESIRADERALALEGIDAALTRLTERIADAHSLTGRDLFGERPRRSRAAERRVSEWRRQRRDLAALRRRVDQESALPFFSYDVHFGATLAHGGFDVVLGNPPWVRGEALPSSLRAALARRYASWRSGSTRAGFSHTPDLSVAFVERALELARPGGVVAFLLPAKLLRAGYAAQLRGLLRREATVLFLGDRSHGTDDGFDATVFPLVLVLRREPASADAAAQIETMAAGGRVIRGAAQQRDLAADEAPTGAPWLALPADLARAVRAALDAGPRLRSVYRPSLGVKTGANEVFVRSVARPDGLPDQLRAAALLGRDVAPFSLHPSAVVLAALDDQGRPLAQIPSDVARYLGSHRGRLRRRADARAADLPPWALFRTDLLRAEWIVLWRDIALRLEAATLHRVARHDPIPLNTCYGVAVPNERTTAWLTAYLNSRVARSLAAAVAERASGGAYRFSAATVGCLPLPPDPAGAAVRALEAIGRSATRGDPYDQDELDSLAARALELDQDTADHIRFLGDALCRDPGGHR